MAAQSPDRPRDLPLISDDRYECQELIGAGGMGRVYKAWDQKLKRTVALKIMMRDSEDHQVRFLREAESQARIDHENVCRIYDTGIIQGQAYIAMQYLEGQPLSVAYKTMTIREKVCAIISAARGVHAAHRLGIVHRDLKPANLMVWKGEDGQSRTSVLDFGLARDLGNDGTTSTGIVVGTVQYIAPEQATGDSHKLDRRTDVYSLGVSLYEILAGRVPFDGVTALDSLVSVIHAEPERFAKEAAIPEDLETIVLKCLEKEQHRRYDSALELAEELERFVAGDQIRARRSSVFYRGRRVVQRHRQAAIVLAIVLAIAAVLGGISLRHAAVLQRQLTYAQLFSEDVHYIEALIRHAHTSPLHDLSAEREHARAYIQKLQQNVAKEGVIASGPGFAAIGAALLAVGDMKEAAEALETSWQTGYRTPQLSYALGTIRGWQYQEELMQIDRMINPEARKQRAREADAKFRAPALELLKQARGVKEQSPEYVEALIAFYDNRLDQSTKLIDEVLNRYPWMYEARVLRARVEMTHANEQREKGDYDRATGYYSAADRAFLEALQDAPSDPAVYEQLCGLWADQMQFEVQSRGGDMRPHIKRADSACSAALMADPKSAGAYTKLASAYSRFGQWQWKRDIDFREATTKGCAAAERAVALAPSDEWAHYTRSLAYFWRSTSPAYSEAERLAFVDQSLESARRSVALNPNLTHAYTMLGNSALARHNVLILRGSDPRSVLREAMDAYTKAIALDRRFMSPYNNLGHTWTHYGDYERLVGIDPTEAYMKAAVKGKEGHEVNPAVSSPIYVAANAHRLLADVALEQGRDPRPSALRSIEWSSKEISIAPREHGGYFLSALAHLVLAQYERMEGRSAASHEAVMLRRFSEAVALSPDTLIAHMTRARIRYWQASDPARPLAERKAMLDDALERADHATTKHPQSAELASLVAGCMRARGALGGSPASLLARARRLEETAHAMNPLMCEKVRKEMARRAASAPKVSAKL